MNASGGRSISAHISTRLRGAEGLRLAIVSPARRGSTLGNSVTTERYATIFRRAGWKVSVLGSYSGEDIDILVALHAKKSGDSARAFRQQYPDRPLVIVLTGTDLYRDIRHSRLALRAMEAADSLVTLQPLGRDELGPALCRKTVCIVQSSPVAPCQIDKRGRTRRALRICVLGHLRREKDPLRAAYAVRSLPRSIAVVVTQAGGVLDERLERLAQRESTLNPRYHWIGELTRAKALSLLRRSDALVISSRMEGGANVVSEAIACGVPIFASAVPGNIGLLGANYPGLFALGDTGALAALMKCAVEQERFLPGLRGAIRRLQPMVEPARESRAWLTLVKRLSRSAGYAK